MTHFLQPSPVSGLLWLGNRQPGKYHGLSRLVPASKSVLFLAAQPGLQDQAPGSYSRCQGSAAHTQTGPACAACQHPQSRCAQVQAKGTHSLNQHFLGAQSAAGTRAQAGSLERCKLCPCEHPNLEESWSWKQLRNKQQSKPSLLWAQTREQLLLLGGSRKAFKKTLKLRLECKWEHSTSKSEGGPSRRRGQHEPRQCKQEWLKGSWGQSLTDLGSWIGGHLCPSGRVRGGKAGL